MICKIIIANNKGFPETCSEDCTKKDGQCPMLMSKKYGQTFVCGLFDLEGKLFRRKRKGDSPGCNTGFLIPNKKCMKLREETKP